MATNYFEQLRVAFTRRKFGLDAVPPKSADASAKARAVLAIINAKRVLARGGK